MKSTRKMVAEITGFPINNEYRYPYGSIQEMVAQGIMQGRTQMLNHVDEILSKTTATGFEVPITVLRSVLEDGGFE